MGSLQLSFSVLANETNQILDSNLNKISFKINLIILFSFGWHASSTNAKFAGTKTKNIRQSKR